MNMEQTEVITGKESVRVAKGEGQASSISPAGYFYFRHSLQFLEPVVSLPLNPGRMNE